MDFDILPIDDKVLMLSREGKYLERRIYNDFFIDSFVFNKIIYDVYQTKSLMPFLIGRCVYMKEDKVKRIVKYEDLTKLPSLTLLHFIFTTNDRSISYKLGANDDSEIYQLFDFFATIPDERNSEEIIQIELSRHPPPSPSDFDDKIDFYQNRHYDDNIDMNQQSDDFWNET